MNKLYADTKDGKLLICILEPGNIHALVDERRPLYIDLNEDFFKTGLPAKLKVSIFYSETPIKDQAEFEHMITPGGTVIDRRTGVTKTKVPHCPECRSTIEQLGVWRSETPVWLVFCTCCGCAFGSMPNTPALLSSGG